ncbi:MAG TPA: NUDIX hydrolase [Caldilineae bacterium]|nr:NUDIX hydrolase [Caldilineae bacterium]
MRFELNFCPRCGHLLEDREAFGRIRRVCPACGFVFFRDHKIAVGALIERDGHVLLARRAVTPQKGKWALPAGYMDYGETPEDALRREVKEETGLDITVGDVLSVFPLDNPDARGVIIIYWAQTNTGEPRADDDVSEVAWFAPDELPEDLAFESTRQALALWRTRCLDASR